MIVFFAVWFGSSRQCPGNISNIRGTNELSSGGQLNLNLASIISQSQSCTGQHLIGCMCSMLLVYSALLYSTLLYSTSRLINEGLFSSVAQHSSPASLTLVSAISLCLGRNPRAYFCLLTHKSCKDGDEEDEEDYFALYLRLYFFAPLSFKPPVSPSM